MHLTKPNKNFDFFNQLKIINFEVLNEFFEIKIKLGKY